jgi:hypothetical protein
MDPYLLTDTPSLHGSRGDIEVFILVHADFLFGDGFGQVGPHDCVQIFPRGAATFSYDLIIL